MAKTYLSTVKYLIKMDFKISGIVDKHDIIGAIFGQSEGLVGEDMDLKELQKNGKLGRIEVKEKVHSGKTSGSVTIPSGMDRVKTSLLAAAIESVDKVGPCEAEFNTKEIEDTRTKKRKAVKERAQELLKRMSEEIPESDALAESIVGGMRGAGIQEFGREKQPAGPEVGKSKEIIIVEGRADVINLLKHGIKNCIAINGAKIPQSVVELSRKKTVTVFVDGDRGGDLIARQMSHTANVDYVAKAPAGKEVEELTLKEILASLKRKQDAKDTFGGRSSGRHDYKKGSGKKRGDKDYKSHKKGSGRNQGRKSHSYSKPQKTHGSEEKKEEAREEAKPSSLGEFSKPMEELANSLKARILDKNMKTVKELSVRNLLEEMQKQKSPHAVVFDGIITQRLVDQAKKSGASYLVGVKKGKLEDTGNVKVLSQY